MVYLTFLDKSLQNVLISNKVQNYSTLEVDRNPNILAGTRNQPGIRFLVLVPGFENFCLPGYLLGYGFWKIPFFLGEPGSSCLITGQTRKLLVSPRSSWC
jgi:hypothetical protein